MTIPRLTAAGNYFKPELKKYVDECRARDVDIRTMAGTLRVPLDRIIYLMSKEGYQNILGGVK